MHALPPEAQHHLNASRGWLELGEPVEASRELDRVAPTLRVHPDVLEMRWQIYGKMKWWSAALEMASAICELAPERASGWILRAHSLHRLERTERAWESLKEVAERFPDIAMIPYCLACYACRLERKDEAWQWLERAMDRGGVSKIAQMALTESDLQLLWSRIAEKLTDLRAMVAQAQDDFGHASESAEAEATNRIYSFRPHSSANAKTKSRA